MNRSLSSLLLTAALSFACSGGGGSSDEGGVGGSGITRGVISSTANMHHPHAKAALERGLHVLIEKPMTITVAQANELVELAQARDRHFLISGPWHYTDHAAEARRLVRSGALGTVKMISVLMTNFTVGFYRGDPDAGDCGSAMG